MTDSVVWAGKKMAGKKLAPISRAFLSSGGAAPAPKEGRFETAQALKKRLSLRMHRKSSKWRERGWIRTLAPF
jgi:hypothetical protein